MDLVECVYTQYVLTNYILWLLKYCQPVHSFFLLVSIFINPHVNGRVACRHSAKPKRIEWLSFFVVYLSCDMMLTYVQKRGACSQWLVLLPPLWCCNGSASALGLLFFFFQIKYSKQVTDYMLWWQMGLFYSRLFLTRALQVSSLLNVNGLMCNMAMRTNTQ